MAKLKDILFEYEAEETKDPNKILVINKKSGEQYYINKQNFDPDIHDRTDKEVVGKKEDEKGEDEGGEGGKGDDKKGEKETPKEEKSITPLSFISSQRQDAIVDKMPEIRPDLKKALLGYDFNELFNLYDSIVTKIKAGKSDYIKMAKSIGMKMQAVSLAKYAIISESNADEFGIAAAKGFRKNAKIINEMLRGKYTKKSDAQMLGIQKLINALDRHFKSKQARLKYDCVVFRGATPGAYKMLISSKQWVDKGFVSTSLNPFIGETFSTSNGQFSAPMRSPLFAIQLNEGDPVLITPCSEDPNCNETDITLPRGCKFTISEHNEKTNVYTLTVEFPYA